MIDDFDLIKSVIVRQSNHLVESPYTQEFTAHEIKLFEIALSQCTKNDNIYVERKSDKEFVLYNSELAKLLNTKPSVISMEIEKTARRIMDKKLHLRRILDDGSVEFEMINIIPYARYKDGVLTFRLNYAIIPYLLEINKNFTEYKLDFILSLNSAYAIKLYKLVCQYNKLKFRSFTVENLKEQFGLTHKYKQYNDFKKNIIIPSISQINKKTNLKIDYKEFKIGRKIAKIEFNFNMQNKPIHSNFTVDNNNKLIEVKPMLETLELADISKLLKNMKSEISTNTKKLILKLYKAKGIDYIEASINYATQNAKTNLDKYLFDTLTNGWAEVELLNMVNKKLQQQKQKELARQEKLAQDSKLEAESKNKLTIESEWNNLSFEEMDIYSKYADYIMATNTNKLDKFSNIATKLPICCYAVSNGKTYSKSIERYCIDFLKINLDLFNR